MPIIAIKQIQFAIFTEDNFNLNLVMEQESRIIREHLYLTGASVEEEAYLTGIVCGLKATQTSDSCITYIGDLEKGHILWLSSPGISRWKIEEIAQPLTIGTLPIYSTTVQEQLSLYDTYSLKFIQSIASSDINEYTAINHVSIDGCIYERRISFVSLDDSSVPRFVLCKLSVSSHPHPTLPKIMRNGDSYYYRLKHAPCNWVKKELIKLERREQLILQLSAEGLKEAEIATRIHVSLPRLKSIKGAMFEKMHVRNLCQAVRRAHLFRLIAPDLSLNELLKENSPN